MKRIGTSTWASIAALAAGLAGAALPLHHAAAGTVASFDSPTLDVWNYPFAGNPGGDTDASVFASQEHEMFSTTFDNRDGQMLIGFDTDAQVTEGLAAGRYRITSVTLTATVATNNAFLYDPTYDAVSTYFVYPGTPDEADADAGRPMELFAVGYRNGFSLATYEENAGYAPIGTNVLQQGVRNAYPVDFTPAGVAMDASNNVAQDRDVTPAAVGTITGLTPGSPVPAESTMTFALNLDAPGLKNYLQQGLAAGRLNFMLTTLYAVQQQQSTVSPTFYTRENLLGEHPTLSIDFTIAAGASDFNGVNGITVQDIFDFLTAWLAGSPEADFNTVNGVTVQDIFDFLTAWLAGA